MKIGITGVPGSGKTTLAKLLSKAFNYPLINVKHIVKKYKLGNEVDLKKLEKIIKLPENCIIESHLLIDMNLKLDIMIVLHKSPKELEDVYKKRKYDNEKIAENIASELQDYFFLKRRSWKKIFHIDATSIKPKDLLIKTLSYIILNKQDLIDYSKELIDYALKQKI